MAGGPTQAALAPATERQFLLPSRRRPPLLSFSRPSKYWPQRASSGSQGSSLFCRQHPRRPLQKSTQSVWSVMVRPRGLGAPAWVALWDLS